MRSLLKRYSSGSANYLMRTITFHEEATVEVEENEEHEADDDDRRDDEADISLRACRENHANSAPIIRNSSRFVAGSVMLGRGSAADTVWTFGFLTGGVGADRGALDDGARINSENIFGYGHHEAIHATGCGTTLLLTDTVVLRAVTWALEPL